MKINELADIWRTVPMLKRAIRSWMAWTSTRPSAPSRPSRPLPPATWKWVGVGWGEVLLPWPHFPALRAGVRRCHHQRGANPLRCVCRMPTPFICRQNAQVQGKLWRPAAVLRRWITSDSLPRWMGWNSTTSSSWKPRFYSWSAKYFRTGSTRKQKCYSGNSFNSV